MIYHFTISVSAGVSEANKVQTILKLCRGVIHQIDVYIPAGHEGLAHLTLNQGLHQVWPSNQGESFAGDDNEISFREHYRLYKQPYRLEAWTWNVDDTYSHSFVIRVGVLPEDLIIKRLF